MFAKVLIIMSLAAKELKLSLLISYTTQNRRTDFNHIWLVSFKISSCPEWNDQVRHGKA